MRWCRAPWSSAATTRRRGDQGLQPLVRAPQHRLSRQTLERLEPADRRLHGARPAADIGQQPAASRRATRSMRRRCAPASRSAGSSMAPIATACPSFSASRRGPSQQSCRACHGAGRTRQGLRCSRCSPAACPPRPNFAALRRLLAEVAVATLAGDGILVLIIRLIFARVISRRLVGMTR